MAEFVLKLHDWHFDFTIEGMTALQADALMDIIIAFGDALGCDNGGGCAPVEEAEVRAELAKEDEFTWQFKHNAKPSEGLLT